MSAGLASFDEKVLIPDLLKKAPQARAVLDRYGLRGCGGPLGPVETLGFFAKAHDVPLPRLLDELRHACDQSGAAPETAPPQRELADTIYRLFFKAGIAVVLSLGAVWGAYLLLRIAFAGRFDEVGLHEVNAHGHAQIFGWVGLFVMGFAYQAFPRFKHTSLAYPRLACFSWGVMLTGIISRAVFEPWVADAPWTRLPALTGSLFEVVAVCLFAGIILQTWRRSGKPLAVYDYYILSALIWFVIQAIYDTAYFASTAWTTEHAALVDLVAGWQGSLREIQIHGFALLMILGVSQRIFPHFYGLPAPSSGFAAVALVGLNVAVVGESSGLVLMHYAGHAWAGLWYASVLLLAGTVVTLVRGWHVFAATEESDRSLKFLRAAYVWLFLSLGMLVLLPLYQYGLLAWIAPESGSARLGFSHAYYGAIRHAITVGFISLMIVGVAAKVVPTLNGVDVRALSKLWAPFVLLNLGCALRVASQTATDFTAGAFPVAGVSGVLEVSGLALWGVHLWLIMIGRARARAIVPAAQFTTGMPITAAHLVGDVLDRYPFLLKTFLACGFRPLANPLFRRTVARFVTIEQACRQVGVDLAPFLQALNASIAKQAGARVALPVLALN
jgi:ABC-type amino acid transport system permease subunit